MKIEWLTYQSNDLIYDPDEEISYGIINPEDHDITDLVGKPTSEKITRIKIK